MFKMKYPNYNKSIVNLSNSILKYFGAESIHASLQEIDEIWEKKQYKNVVLMVFDGLGEYNINQILDEESFLNRHKKAVISSVFPPTTTAATTSLESGLQPCEHGWLGWSLYFNEVENNVNLFINTTGDNLPAADYHVARTYLSYENNIDKINKAGLAHAESVSRFGTCYAEELEDIVSEAVRLCAEEGRHYIYTYYNEPDSSMHSLGVDSLKVAEQVARINRAVEQMSRQVEETLIIVTADHGHINTQNVWIGDYPQVANLLKHPPAIEPRTLSLYVKEEAKEHFREVFEATFGQDFLLLSQEEIINMKLFGNGDIHPRLKDFTGDYVAIATGGLSVFSYQGEAEAFIGVHAGLTEEEMMVPLIVIP